MRNKVNKTFISGQAFHEILICNVKNKSSVWNNLILCVLLKAMPSEDQSLGLKHPGLMLKYSTFKNLASMAASRDDLETAMEFYLEVKQ